MVVFTFLIYFVIIVKHSIEIKSLMKYNLSQDSISLHFNKRSTS